MSFPRWKYHATLEPKIIHSESEEKALGKGWEDSPAAFEPKSEPVKKDPGQPEPKAKDEKKPEAPAKKSKLGSAE